jgi:hypothetical protein
VPLATQTEGGSVFRERLLLPANSEWSVPYTGAPCDRRSYYPAAFRCILHRLPMSKVALRVERLASSPTADEEASILNPTDLGRDAVLLVIVAATGP